MRDTIKVCVIADQTGALSPLGGAQANTATLVVDEINASGGVLGRRVELLIEDSASDEPKAAAAATTLVHDPFGFSRQFTRPPERDRHVLSLTSWLAGGARRARRPLRGLWIDPAQERRWERHADVAQ